MSIKAKSQFGVSNVFVEKFYPFKEVLFYATKGIISCMKLIVSTKSGIEDIHLKLNITGTK